MPKSTDKKGTKRRKAQNSTLNLTTGVEGSVAKVILKRKKPNPDDGIAVSKQLASKLRNRTRTTNLTKASTSNKSSEPRICPNGKPMPSLAELEMMYEDSDGDEEPLVTTKTFQERISSPIRKTSTFNDHESVSPTVLKQITSKVIDLISNLPDPTTLDNDGPPPPVIPQKRPKKSDRPYIDGCKDRPQVPWNPKSVVGKSNDKYGIELYEDSEDEENMCPKKRRKKSNCGNISKSIFNAQSDDIAAMLKENESREVVSGSPDSNKTVSYDYSDNSPTRNVPRSFSPLPSTSRDSETILKNDQLFNESFQCENVSSDKMENDVDITEILCEKIVVGDGETIFKNDQTFNDSSTCENISNVKIENDIDIIEVSCDTIVVGGSETFRKKDQLFNEKSRCENVSNVKIENDIDIIEVSCDTIVDGYNEKLRKKDQLYEKSQCEYVKNENDIDIIEVPCETIVVDDATPTSVNKVFEYLDNTDDDDDCCVIVESNIKTKRELSPINIEDDFYSTLDLLQNFDTEVCEIIDVDDVIAENTAFINKYCKDSNLNSTITCVDPNVSYVPNRQRKTEQNVTPSEEGSTDHVVLSDMSHAVNANVFQNVYDPPSEHSLHSAPQQVNICNTQSNVQPSTTTNPCQNTPNRNNEISVIVTNFFNQPEDARNSSSGAIDLSTGSRSVMSNISSWMSSIGSYFRGNESTAQSQNNLTPLSMNANTLNTSHNHNPHTLISYPPTSRSICPDHNVPITSQSRRNNVQVNVPPLQCRHRTPRKRSRRQNNLVISNIINVPPDITSITQVNQVRSVPQTQTSLQPLDESPVRGLGDCPICMDSLANNAVASTLCGHVFCMNCIKAAIKANGKKCPTCRKALKGVGYHQLFL